MASALVTPDSLREGRKKILDEFRKTDDKEYTAQTNCQFMVEALAISNLLGEDVKNLESREEIIKLGEFSIRRCLKLERYVYNLHQSLVVLNLLGGDVKDKEEIVKYLKKHENEDGMYRGYKPGFLDTMGAISTLKILDEDITNRHKILKFIKNHKCSVGFDGYNQNYLGAFAAPYHYSLNGTYQAVKIIDLLNGEKPEGTKEYFIRNLNKLYDEREKFEEFSDKFMSLSDKLRKVAERVNDQKLVFNEDVESINGLYQEFTDIKKELIPRPMNVLYPAIMGLSTLGAEIPKKDLASELVMLEQSSPYLQYKCVQSLDALEQKPPSYLI